MHLDGDFDALCAYHAADRESPLVADYFSRLELKGLPYAWKKNLQDPRTPQGLIAIPASRKQIG